jgi:hypothetical protein
MWFKVHRNVNDIRKQIIAFIKKHIIILFMHKSIHNSDRKGITYRMSYPHWSTSLVNKQFWSDQSAVDQNETSKRNQLPHDPTTNTVIRSNGLWSHHLNPDTDIRKLVGGSIPVLFFGRSFWECHNWTSPGRTYVDLWFCCHQVWGISLGVINDYTSRTQGCVTSMWTSLEWQTLEQRRRISRLVMMYKIQHPIPVLFFGRSFWECHNWTSPGRTYVDLWFCCHQVLGISLGRCPRVDAGSYTS